MKKEKRDLSEFKDVRGAHRTESLFIEMIQSHIAKKYTPLYSLRDYDNKGYTSAYNIWMEATDEHEAALTLVGSLAHWRKLCRLKWFIEGVPLKGFEGLKQWRKDMIARDASTAKATLIEETEEGNVTAAKALFSLDRESKKGIKNTGKTAPATVAEKEVDSAINGVLDNIVNIKG